jgi:hypothetical protein
MIINILYISTCLLAILCVFVLKARVQYIHSLQLKTMFNKKNKWLAIAIARTVLFVFQIGPKIPVSFLDFIFCLIKPVLI